MSRPGSASWILNVLFLKSAKFAHKRSLSRGEKEGQTIDEEDRRRKGRKRERNEKRRYPKWTRYTERADEEQRKEQIYKGHTKMVERRGGRVALGHTIYE